MLLADGRMTEVILQIQATRDNCVPRSCGTRRPTRLTPHKTQRFATVAVNTNKVGDLTIPRGLLGQGSDGDQVRLSSGRDSENNILVYWDRWNRGCQASFPTRPNIGCTSARLNN